MAVSPQMEAPFVVRPLKGGDTNAQYIDCMDVLRLPNYHGEVAPAEVATKTEIQQQQTVLVLKFISPNFRTDTVFSYCCVQSLVYTLITRIQHKSMNFKALTI